MNKSNDEQDQEEEEFWKKGYEPSERTKKALEPEPNKITRKAKLSFDGEQFYVRFPKEIAEIKDLNKKFKVKFTGIEYPPEAEKKNEVKMELVESKDAES